MKQQKVWSCIFCINDTWKHCMLQKFLYKVKFGWWVLPLLSGVSIFIPWINYLWSGLSIKLLLYFYLLVLKHCLCGWAKWYCSAYLPCQLATSMSACVCSTLLSCHTTWSRAVTLLILLLVNVSSAIKIAVIPSTAGSSVVPSELLCLLRLVGMKFSASRWAKCIWNGTKNFHG